MSEQATIDINIGEHTLHFAVGDADINRYLNELGPSDKVKCGYNFLARTVIEEDKPAFKKLALAADGVTPRGAIVMQVATLVAAEFGGDLEITVKKPDPSPTASNVTVINN